jgi:nucleotide-binding universal stress UspA family protein
MKILLAVDGSEPSLTAVSLVRSLALPTDSTVELLTVVANHCWNYTSWPVVTMTHYPAVMERIVTEVRERLDALAAALAASGRTVDTMIRYGRPASEIVFEADRLGADLLVVGARGHGMVERVVLGSVSSEVADQAHCPVLVVRTPGIARILVATDGSAEGDLAAAYVGTARIFGDPTVKVLSVVDPGMPWWTGMEPVDGMVASDTYTGVLDAANRRAREVATTTADRLAIDNVVAQASPVEGEVGSTIVDAATAWQADVVVLGTRGHGAARRMLVGSTSRHVLHRAPMSVLIVRPGSARSSVRADAA